MKTYDHGVPQWDGYVVAAMRTILRNYYTPSAKLGIVNSWTTAGAEAETRQYLSQKDIQYSSYTGCAYDVALGMLAEV